MQSIQATPATQLVRALEAAELAPRMEAQPFVPIECVPITLAELKARAIQAAAESQTDKSIDHTLCTCGTCGGVWRGRGYSLCPMCAGHVGDILFLDYDQRIDLSDAVFDQKEVRTSYTQEQLGRALGEFRTLLDEYVLWYDRTNRRLIQACHSFLCRAGGTSSKVALAIHFFKEEWARASDDEKTFCPEVKQ